MTTDLALTAASLASDWPYCLIGQTWNLQHGGYFSTTGEIVAIHSVESVGGYEPNRRLFFVKLDNGQLAVIPENAIQRYYRDSNRKEAP